MEKSVLFLPASIRSHVIPALYLADLMSREFNIYFAVTSEILEEIIVEHGFKAIRTATYRAGLGMEGRYLSEQKSKVNRWEILKSIWRNDLYVYRQKELSDIIDQIKPTVILIDIFNSTDLLVLYPIYKSVKFIFFNPMLSTCRVNGFPTVDQGYWQEHQPLAVEKKLRKGIPLKAMITRPIESLLTAALDNQFKKLTELDRFSFNHPIASDNTSALLFDNIQEIILAPLALEISPEVRKQNQHYLGLCVNEGRLDTELDVSFESHFEKILESKKLGGQLIYCTFGTFYQGSDRALLDFLNRLLDALEGLKMVQAIFSVNKLVIDTLSYQRKIPDYIHMFTRVTQLRVLKEADLFVTHGGLGSIKESIYYGVPMLVYPLDLKYDQNGNGLKVEYHGLGLRGVFQFERTADMIKKIEELLFNDMFKSNVSNFREKCSTTHSITNVKNSLKQLTD